LPIICSESSGQVIRVEENLPIKSRPFPISNYRARFASDEQCVSLREKASEQNLKPDEIKRLIKNWPPDHHGA
jgi:hypothetical protein